MIIDFGSWLILGRFEIELALLAYCNVDRFSSMNFEIGDKFAIIKQ